jgi:glycosyltransferase involved in cell wall biosynthesis
MFWFGWIVCFGVAAAVIPAVIALKLKRLKLPMTVQSGDPLPGVSIIVPARNEASEIRNALISLLNSEGVEIELIAVDDRSTDSTGQIMDEVAAADSRVKVIHLTSIEDGWLGKNHAMKVGASLATKKFLLFTDGDIHYVPKAIEAAVRHVQQHRLQHLCLLPKMEPGSLLENVLVSFFGLAFATGMQLHLIRTRWPMSYAGVGAFNLVEASFYRSFGGHQPIALDVLDDVKLGKMIKKNGGRSDFQMADEWLSVRWQPSLWGVIKGLEKNGFASLNYSVKQLVFVTLVFFVTMLFPCISPLFLPFHEASGFIATAAVWHVSYAGLVYRLPGAWRMVPLFMTGPCLMIFAFWRSAVITLRQGGIRWRDSFYPLKELRKSLYH